MLKETKPRPQSLRSTGFSESPLRGSLTKSMECQWKAMVAIMEAECQCKAVPSDLGMDGPRQKGYYHGRLGTVAALKERENGGVLQWFRDVSDVCCTE